MENSLESYDEPERPVWIAKNEFPFEGEIISAEKVKGRYGIDVRVQILSTTGQIRHFDLWGANLNAMTHMKGIRFADWMKTKVLIHRGEDLKRVLSFIL